MGPFRVVVHREAIKSLGVCPSKGSQESDRSLLCLLAHEVSGLLCDVLPPCHVVLVGHSKMWGP